MLALGEVTLPERPHELLEQRSGSTAAFHQPCRLLSLEKELLHHELAVP
jgi:hypothetical protein